MTWVLYAQRRLKREQKFIGGNVYYAFGSLSRANQGAGDGVSQVELTVDDDGAYWGWLPRFSPHPMYVCDSEDSLAIAFSCGDRTKQIHDAARCGRGKIVRLSVKELEEVSA